MSTSRTAVRRAATSAGTGVRVWAALWVVYIVWGSTYLAIRVAVRTLPPLLHGAARFLVAGGLLLLFLVWRRGAAGVKVSGRELAACALTGALFLAGGNGVVAIAEQHVASARAALIIASVPLWVVVLRLFVRQRVGPGTLLSVALGFVGVAFLVASAGGSSAPLGAQLLLVAAALSWATGSFLTARVALPRDPLVSTALQMLCGGALLAAGGIAAGEVSALELGRVSPASAWALAYLIAFGSLLAFTSYTWVLRHAPISKVATYAYVNPVVAVLLGWVLLSEAITARMLGAAAIIVASVALTVRHETVRA